MAQSDLVLANVGFPAARVKINEMTEALASNAAGTTEPATTYAYQWWVDTTASVLKQRNGTNTAWVSVAPLGAGLLPLSGGTLTGALTLPASDPSGANDAARKAYVDAQRDTRLALAGGTLTGALTLPGAPTADLHAATKGYVDGAIAAAASTTEQVLTATAGAAVGAVGSYALAWRVTEALLDPGDTVAGSDLRYANDGGNGGEAGRSTTALPGTWRLMGALTWRLGASGFFGTQSPHKTSLWLRIA
jgi:hypothetical protein